jgi:hypothetical protein
MPVQDRAAIEYATRRGDLLDGAGPAAVWSPDTLKSYIERYGRWMGYLERQQKLIADQMPADRVTPEVVAGYLECLKRDMDVGRLSSEALHGYVRGLLNVMLKIAPDRDWAWLRTVAENARKVAKPSRDKRLQVRPSFDLYGLGKSLMREADDPNTATPRERAVRFRDGLKIAVLATRATRRGSLAKMNVEQHLTKIGDRYWIVFADNETKQRRDTEDYLPPDLTPFIDRYINCHRWVLRSYAKPPEDEPAVWLSEKGTRLGAAAISFQVKLRTHRAFGVAIPPHRFRDCLATSIAYELPGHVYVGAPMLHQSTLGVMERHYDQSEARCAFNRFHDHLSALRRELAHLVDDEKFDVTEE